MTGQNLFRACRGQCARWIVIFAGVWAELCASHAEARPRLENICTISGQQEQRLIGLGLVTGLKGTGDGGKYLPMINALGAALAALNNPASGPNELKDAGNVALVLIEATVPANGIRRGQRLDCFVNSIGAAKSLRGGRLMIAPLGTQIVTDERVMGIASGAVLIEDAQVTTSGKITGGVVITEDVINNFIQNNQFTLLLDHDHASFRSASEVARVVNADISFEANGRQLARAVGPGVVQVAIPEQYRADAMQFIAQVLDVGIDNPHTQARVVVNAKAGTVIVTGEVEISPVAISHKNLTLTVGSPEEQAAAGLPPPEPVAGVGFVPLMDQQTRQSPQRLKQLIDALNQLKVPTTDVIDILKDLHRAGKLHAELITE
jgi:flagellar P-ring protein precursor FlgI